VTLVLESRLFRSWAVSERNVPVPKVLKEVDLFLRQEKTGSNGVDRGITPTLVEETTVLIEALEVVHIWLRAKPIEVADFEVGPLKNMLA
jgi:hypothetical protein